VTVAVVIKIGFGADLKNIPFDRPNPTNYFTRVSPLCGCGLGRSRRHAHRSHGIHAKDPCCHPYTADHPKPWWPSPHKKL